MAGAAVAAEGANPTTSDRLGWFTLDFPSKGPGDLVKLTVSKPELVSVHWIMLDVTLPSKAGGMNVLPLLMARESDRLEMAAEFFRFAKPACD